MSIQTQTGSDTRNRVLEAAGEVFAERGFREATIREICQRAGANIAAVNYHFRDKEALYAEVLKQAHSLADERYPPTAGMSPELPADRRLHAFVRNFLLRLFDPHRPAWHGLLMARELLEPSPALDQLVDETIRPRYRMLLEIVGGILGPGVSPEQARLCANSVIGQCLFYHLGRRLMSRLEPERAEPVDVDPLVEHVTRFSLGALRSVAGDGG